MNDSNSTQQPDKTPLEGEAPAEPKSLEGEAPAEPEPYPMPELPPLPEIPPPPEGRFERPHRKPSRSPRFMEASRGMAIAFSVGFALTGPVILGALLGVWLDNTFKTSPWLTLILLLIGIVTGFTQMIRLLNRLQNEQERKP